MDGLWKHIVIQNLMKLDMILKFVQDNQSFQQQKEHYEDYIIN